MRTLFRVIMFDSLTCLLYTGGSFFYLFRHDKRSLFAIFFRICSDTDKVLLEVYI